MLIYKEQFDTKKGLNELIVTLAEQLRTLDHGNRFIGDQLPTLENSSIDFQGSNNILVCTPGVRFHNTRLSFQGNRSVIFIGGTSRNTISLHVAVRHNCAFFLGENNYLNKTLTVDCSEAKMIFIGNNCLISHGVSIRTADPHLIYDVETLTRLNPSKSVFVGDHVWIGQGVQIMKGTQISSGSIIGAGSVVSGKKIENNAVYAGNPARRIRSGVFFDNALVHRWTEADTALSMNYSEYLQASEYRRKQSPDQFIFTYVEKASISFAQIQQEIENRFRQQGGALLVANYLTELNNCSEKNRFVQAFPS